MLDHPHILPLFDYGDAHLDDMVLAYLVMPYRQDGSLADWLRRRRIPHLSPQEGMHILVDAMHLRALAKRLKSVSRPSLPSPVRFNRR